MSFIKPKKECKSPRGGYTIIELMVSMGLFVIVALMVADSFLGVMNANRKTLAIRTAMDNLNFAIESMSRDMKTGFNYHCGSSLPYGDTQDCVIPPNPAFIAFEGQNGDPGSDADQIIYKLGPAGPSCPSPEQICRSADGGATFFAVTAPPPELKITGLGFRVYGSNTGDTSDTDQPRIVIVIIGTAGQGITESTFDIQTTISQRLPDN